MIDLRETVFAGFVLVMGCYITAHMIHDILTFFSDYED